MDEATVAALVERACAGDADAFAELYQQHRSRVFGICRRLLGSATAAEDGTNELFLRAQRSLKTYERSRPFSR